MSKYLSKKEIYINPVNHLQLLVALGVVCYRKATNLKRAVVQKQNHDADPDRSDSTVYFQDMILCSEDSETDDGITFIVYLRE